MDRQIVYPGAIPLETDLLNTNRNVLVALAKLAQAVWGTTSSSSPFVHGLACAPTTPASLQVTVAAGQIYAVEDLDATAYSSLAADTTDLILKQGVILASTTFTLTPPVSTGQSVVYLIEAAYEDVDGNATTLPYYNASNPAQAYAGPNNSGVAQNTVRQGQCVLQLKQGIAANTGSQAAPSADPGFTPLWNVTVANGQTQITSANIAQVSGAPFLAGLLNQHHLGVPGGAPKINLAAEVQGTLPYANLPPGLAPHGQCRLLFVSTTGIALQPYGGFLVSNNGGALQLPTGGIAAANTSVSVGGVAGQNLAASSVYDVYLNSAGGLEFWLCPTAGGIAGGATHMTDTTAGNVGVEVHNNSGSPDSTKTYVGKVATDASSHFQDNVLQRWVASWFNRRERQLQAFGNNTTYSAFPSWVQLGGASFSALAFGDDSDVLLALSGSVMSQSTSGPAALYWNFEIDGANINSASPQPFANFVPQGYGTSWQASMNAALSATLGEGLHTVVAYHCVNESGEGFDSLAWLATKVRI